VDPGKHGNGIALFKESVLVHATYTGGLGGQVDTLLEPVAPTATLIQQFRAMVGLIDTLVVEQPQIYDNQHQKGEQRSLIELAIAAGALIHAASEDVQAVLRLQPAQWKGQVNKDVMVERIKGKLSGQETQNVELPKAKTLQHNVWDAVGIGLYRLRRIGK